MKNYIHVNLSKYKQYCPFCIFNAENTKADCLKKNDLKRKLKLIFILFLSFSQPIFSITNYSIYDNYTTSNFRDNADLYNEIDFDNIDNDIVKSINAWIKEDPKTRAGSRSNAMQHNQDERSGISIDKTFSILKEYYRNANIKKSDKQIKTEANYYYNH